MNTTTSPLFAISDELITNNTVSETVYQQWDVKRGLRHADGSGVLAGLTQISSVSGTIKQEGKPVPAPGILTYRGYPIDALIETLGATTDYQFERTAFLLLVGRLPTQEELDSLLDYMANHRVLSSKLIRAIQDYPSPSVMNKLQTMVSLLYTTDTAPDQQDPHEVFLKSIAIIAKLPSIVAYSYLAAHKGSTACYVTPEPTMSVAESFLYMLNEGKVVSNLNKTVLDISLVLHAEHGGGNNSSFTTHVIGSSGTDIYSALTGAIGSLKGPLHGAANSKVREMMAAIKTSVSDWSDKQAVIDYLTRILDKEAYDKTGKLYGLGHAVYTLSDPRAVLLKDKAHTLAKTYDRLSEYQLYCTIETEAPALFQKHKHATKVISPNVDFFSGFVYDCLAIPQPVFTPLFAMARAAGWCAHRIEESLSGKRIIRPKYQYVKLGEV